MSPRAAWRLETLGFETVYDYVGGKADWTGANLPLEGTDTLVARAGDAADPETPTCRLDDELAAVRTEVRRLGWDTCIVVNDERVVLGRLGRTAIASVEAESVEDAMTSGPVTVRPDEPLEALERRLRDRGLTSTVVTTSDGRLVGVIRLP